MATNHPRREIRKNAHFAPGFYGQGTWHSYDGAAGLPGAVTAMLQDASGYLWIGSYRDGVSRYDGEQFVFFTAEDGLAHDGIHAIFQDRDGHLWFATAGGASRYDGKSFTNFTVADGLPDDRVRAVLQDASGVLWFATQEGLGYYDGEKMRCLTVEDGLVDSGVNDLVQDTEGNLWAGTERGLSCYDGCAFHNFTAEDGLLDDRILVLAVDRSGGVWVGTPDGASCYTEGRFIHLTTAEGLVHNHVRAIVQSRDSRLWFGTERGASCYDGHTFTAFSTQDGLVHNQIRSILQDAAGDLWIGTSGGISRYSQTFTTLTAEDGLVHDDVKAIVQDRDGRLWMGTGDGLSCYDGTTGRANSADSADLRFVNFTTQDGLVDDRIYALLQDRAGDLWIGTEGGVSRYDGHTFTNFTAEDGLADTAVYAIMQDSQDRLWLSTDCGVSCYDGHTFINYTTEDGLVSNDVSQVFQDCAGDLWISTEGGVSRYDGHTFTNFTAEDGLICDKTDSVIQDCQGRIWITTIEGVDVYENGRFTHFTTADGLPSNKALLAFEDSKGQLWFSTWGGVCRYDGQVFQTFTKEDGLGGTFVPCICEDDDEQLWFATSRGATCYRQPFSSPPRVTVGSVVADRRYTDLADVQIPASAGLLAFEFHSVSFTTRPEAMVYRYRLRGGDNDWEATHDRRVEYPNLAPGRYTFEIVAVDRDLNYSAAATLSLAIVPDHRLEREMARRRVAEQRQQQAVNALEKADEQLELISAREALRWGIEGFIGRSQTIRRILDDVRQVQAAGTTSVLITGESGTGKELIARAIHFGGRRSKGAFIPVNCSAIPAELAESTLFGHVRGAFTGASAERKGAFELADKGTLFLDEIGDMPLPLQAKLLRVLEDGAVTPLGGGRERQVDVRVVTATNADLRAQMEAGVFRQDLYFRLARFPVQLPPLRQRREDISLLAHHFLDLFAAEMGIPHPALNSEALSALEGYAFPGNVRELKNMIEYALIKSSGSPIGLAHLSFMDAAGFEVAKETAAEPQDVGLKSPIETGEEQILTYVRQHGSINNAECRSLLDTQYNRASYLLKKMHSRGLLVRVGERRWARYQLSPDTDHG